MLGLMKVIKDRHEKYADIAERYGVDVNTVWRWAAGNANPTLDTARRLSADYGKPIEYLFSESQGVRPTHLTYLLRNTFF